MTADSPALFVSNGGNVQEFLSMEWGVLHYAIAWIARDYAGSSILYHVVRSMPSLFDDLDINHASTMRYASEK